jgi:hypothetical protein
MFIIDIICPNPTCPYQAARQDIQDPLAHLMPHDPETAQFPQVTQLPQLALPPQDAAAGDQSPYIFTLDPTILQAPGARQQLDQYLLQQRSGT